MVTKSILLLINMLLRGHIFNETETLHLFTAPYELSVAAGGVKKKRRRPPSLAHLFESCVPPGSDDLRLYRERCHGCLDVKRL